MEWTIISLQWYLPIFILGIVFFPLTQKIFKNFSFDFGYPFAKVLAILFVSYTAFVLGTVKILPFNQLNIFIILILYALINIVIIIQRHSGKRSANWRRAHPESDSGQARMTIIIFEELLFLASFLFWVYVRGQEPSIRSLEKFMDFGFINSILRSQFFPPADIWYAGSPINYYYFGHLTGATLIKLINVKPAIGYNLLLSTIFALAVTQVFSLVTGIIYAAAKKINLIKLILFGLLGSFIVNLGGNLHTIYSFTTGYPNENPIPFWQILSGFNPAKYWYPNATRFIPFTIHEFPSYSYVVADLHGHVFDIPFVLLTLAILFLLFTSLRHPEGVERPKDLAKRNLFNFTLPSVARFLASLGMTWGGMVFFGFLTAVHYMTNAFDGPIYIPLILIIFFILLRFSLSFFISSFIFIFSFLIFTFPFSYHFKPFVAGIGVNCGSEIFSYIGKIGPFLFEKGNCQTSPIWMLFILWGFFWINFAIFILIRRHSGDPPAGGDSRIDSGQARMTINNQQLPINNFILLLFSFGTILILIPEFFYIKDIYPAHFRANTMFKLGYQAFIMMGIASSYVFFQIKLLKRWPFFIVNLLLSIFYLLVFIYPFFSIPSYYGDLGRPVDIDGSSWLNSAYPEDKEIIDFLNNKVKNQPFILEAQGDSYTDFERISSMTGLPTVAGWWVHEWLWRGSSNVVAQRIPDIVALYESSDINKTKALIRKYHIKYIIVSKMEKQKYPSLKEDKFKALGKLIFRSSSGEGAIYQLNY